MTSLRTSVCLTAIPKVYNDIGMELKINNNFKQFESVQLSVQELLDLELPGKQNGIAVAVNHQVIPKPIWKNTLLSENDHILIITATQGG